MHGLRYVYLQSIAHLCEAYKTKNIYRNIFCMWYGIMVINNGHTFRELTDNGIKIVIMNVVFHRQQGWADIFGGRQWVVVSLYPIPHRLVQIWSKRHVSTICNFMFRLAQAQWSLTTRTALSKLFFIFLG